jgi:serine/threonine protein kinase
MSHYRIIDKIGSGGMGTVYRAEDINLKRIVALKFLPAELARDQAAKERFTREAHVASGLTHPNICTVHEVCESPDGGMFIAMTYYEGETLKEKIERRPLRFEEATSVAIQLAKGLGVAHRHHVVHRDMKPANVMITADGLVVILDFGLARLSGQMTITRAGIPLGTLAYMSPEQARGEEVDCRTDIWAVGVMLYEMLTGRQPFGGEGAQAVIFSITNNEPKPIARVRAQVPSEIARIVDKCLEKNPSERYQTAEDLRADIEHAQISISSSTQRSWSRGVSKHLARRYPIYSTLITVVIGIAGIVIAYHYKSPYPGHGAASAPKPAVVVLPFKVGPSIDENTVEAVSIGAKSGLDSLRRYLSVAVCDTWYIRECGRRGPPTLAQDRAIADHHSASLILRGNVRGQFASGRVCQIQVDATLIKIEDKSTNAMWSPLSLFLDATKSIQEIETAVADWIAKGVKANFAVQSDTSAYSQFETPAHKPSDMYREFPEEWRWKGGSATLKKERSGSN